MNVIYLPLFRNWGNWAGPENDKYSVQLYEKGQNCWNGPDRSVKVRLFVFFAVIFQKKKLNLCNLVFTYKIKKAQEN